MTGDFGSVPSRSTEKENLELGVARAERKLIRENHGFQKSITWSDDKFINDLLKH